METNYNMVEHGAKAHSLTAKKTISDTKKKEVSLEGKWRGTHKQR
jgi:hypothetical protein